MAEKPRSNREKLNRIEELTKRLYKRGKEPARKTTAGQLRPRTFDIKTKWDIKPPEKEAVEKFATTSPFFKKFFIFSLIFFAAAVVFAVSMFFRGANTVSNENIEIAILGNAFVDGGEELPLQIEITNGNNAALEFSDLLIEYPKGSSGAELGDFERVRTSLGTIPAGKTASESVKIVLFGEEGTTKDVKVKLEYRIEGSNAIFVREEAFAVTISSAPVTLSINAPDKTSSGQAITLNVEVLQNSSEVAGNMRLKVQFPPGFQFTNAMPDPLVGNNIWDLGDLAQGSSKIISINGTLHGQDGEERSFHVYSGEGDDRDLSDIKVVFNSLLHTIEIEQPFIQADLIIGGIDLDEYSVDAQKVVQGKIQWANNLLTRVEDVEITASFSGNAVDEASIVPSVGFYDSAQNLITWNKSTLDTLSTVEPGEKGTVSFAFSSLPLIGGQSLIKDPKITINISIKGRQPTEGNVFKVVNNFESKTVKILSDLQIAAQALHNSGPFTNRGSLPPQVEQETTYTILWSITNSSNAISGAEAKAILPTYIDFTGSVSPSTEIVTFNKQTREITWKIGSVGRGTGLFGDTKEVAFQLGFTPSISQVGEVPQLVGTTTLTGRDTFANATIQSSRVSLNTRLSNDPGFSSGDERVVQ